MQTYFNTKNFVHAHRLFTSKRREEKFYLISSSTSNSARDVGLGGRLPTGRRGDLAINDYKIIIS
jgi:hypothetical protein